MKKNEYLYYPPVYYIRIVLAVCGPVSNNRRSCEAHNIRMEHDGDGWQQQHAEMIENDLNLKSNSLTKISILSYLLSVGFTKMFFNVVVIHTKQRYF